MRSALGIVVVLMAIIAAAWLEDERGRACIRGGGRWVNSNCEMGDLPKKEK